jgi:hypothetical protein
VDRSRGNGIFTWVSVWVNSWVHAVVMTEATRDLITMGITGQDGSSVTEFLFSGKDSDADSVIPYTYKLSKDR